MSFEEYFTPENIPRAPELGDIGDYPADTVDWTQRLWTVWKLKPGAKDKPRWIKACRELRDACAEFGLDHIDDLFCEWHIRLRKGKAYDFKGPESLIGPAKGLAARKRQGVQLTTPIIGGPQSQSAQHRERYLEGEL